MKSSCLACEALRLTSETSDPSIVCPACQEEASALHTMRDSRSNARRRDDDDDEDDDDDDNAPRSKGGSDVAVAAGTAAGAAGLGLGMILLIVGGLFACCLCVPAIGVALLVPAVQKVREAAERTKAMNDVKEIGLTCHSFHDRYKTLPSPQVQPPQPVMAAPDLSWRVSVLEFGMDPGLFNQFDRTQAFNSPRNGPFQSRMPMPYWSRENPGANLTQTHYQYFTGPNTLFPTPLTKITLMAIPDGTSNTFLFAESATPVNWSQNADMNLQLNGPIGVKDRFLVVMCDGSARFVSRANAPDNTLRLLINPRDNQPIPPGWDQ